MLIRKDHRHRPRKLPARSPLNQAVNRHPIPSQSRSIIQLPFLFSSSFRCFVHSLIHSYTHDQPGPETTDTRYQIPDARNQEPETKHWEPGRRNQEPETRDQKPGTKGQGPKARDQRPGTKSQGPKARDQKPGTKSQGPKRGTRTQEPETRNR
jgi:hypothetical protein